jgi:hypothetical protein
MPISRTEHTTFDLFTAPAATKAPAIPAVPKSQVEPDSLVSQPRRFLPKDLAGALKRLDDAEIDALLATVTTEARRRGRLPSSPTKEKSPPDAMQQPRKAPADDRIGSLTAGKLNAVRAAFKAGSSLPRSRGNSVFQSQTLGKRLPPNGATVSPDAEERNSRALVCYEDGKARA